MSKQLQDLLERTEKSIQLAVDYQYRNNTELAEYNAFLVYQLISNISEVLAELDKDEKHTADWYFNEFKDFEDKIRII
jgi:hypothetical protein